jgi:hypothetical protein
MTARVRVMGTPEHTEDVPGDTGNSLPVFAEQELCHRGCPETKPNNFKKMPFWILGGAQKLHFSSLNFGWSNPGVAKAGGLQSQGAKGEAVVCCCNLGGNPLGLRPPATRCRCHPSGVMGLATRSLIQSFNLGSVEVSFLILSFFHILADIFHIINEVIHDPGILEAAGRTIEEDLFYA